MQKCSACGKDVADDSICPVCKKYYCEEHVYPDIHNCKIKKKRILPVDNLMKIGIIFFTLVFIVLVGINTIMLLPERSVLSENSTKNNTWLIDDFAEMEISYAEYLSNTSKYAEQNMIIYGSLSKIASGSGYFAYINDDFGKKIMLNLKNANMRTIFEGSREGQIYEVNGTLKERIGGLAIDIISIKLSERPITAVKVVARAR